MTDREKLIEHVGEIVVPYFAEQIADHLLANGVTVQKWIPVTERLPEEWVDVLALLKSGGCVVAVISGKYWRERWNNELMDRPPTHWMPLPQPPEDGGAENA